MAGKTFSHGINVQPRADGQHIRVNVDAIGSQMRKHASRRFVERIVAQGIPQCSVRISRSSKLVADVRQMAEVARTNTFNDVGI